MVHKYYDKGKKIRGFLNLGDEICKGQLDKLEKELNQANLALTNKGGTPKWGRKKASQYIVKEAISFMSGNMRQESLNQNQNWKRIWQPQLIPKIAFFLWLVIKERMLIINNLRKRGMILVNRCSLYFHEEEDISHLLIHYDYAQDIWRRLWIEGKIMKQKP